MTAIFTPPRIRISTRARAQLAAFAGSTDRALVGFAKVEERDSGKELVVVEACVFEQVATPASSDIDCVTLCRTLQSEMRCFWRTSPAGISPRFNEVDGQITIDLLKVWSYFISLVVDIFGEMEVKYDARFNGGHATSLCTAEFVGGDLSSKEVAEIERACQEQVRNKVKLIDILSRSFSKPIKLPV